MGWKYLNGNYKVNILNDGTKIRETFVEETDFVPDKPETVDLCITEKCTNGCKFCYMDSKANGKHSCLNDLMRLFRGVMYPLEVAIGGGNPLEHPHLPAFLLLLQEQGCIANITINQRDLMKKGAVKYIKEEIAHKYLHGIGVSYHQKEGLEKLYGIKNLVFHLILGVHVLKDVEEILTVFPNAKFLYLGYKELGRAKIKDKEVLENIAYVKNNMDFLFKFCKTLSFDNLALEQLDFKNNYPELYEEFYMGDEGAYSFYVDAVNMKFAQSSLIEKDKYKNIGKRDNIIKIFKKL